MLPTPTPAIAARLDRAETQTRDDVRATVRTGLPAPAQVAARVALAVCEIEAGVRPFGQLERLCHPSLRERLAARVGRAGGPAVTAASLRRVITREHPPGWSRRSCWSAAAPGSPHRVAAGRRTGLLAGCRVAVLTSAAWPERVGPASALGRSPGADNPQAGEAGGCLPVWCR
jgi:hypothetical protein